MNTESQSRRAKRLAVNVVLLAASCSLVVLLSEALVRRVAPQRPAGGGRDGQPRDFYAPHPALGFTMNPAFRGRFRQAEFDTDVRFNSAGLRDREHGVKPPGTKRLVVLGDSYTFGWGVDEGERFTDRLEDRLRDAAPGVWDVVRAGTNAYATTHERAWMQAYGWGLGPDLVVLQFCMGNDFADNRGVRYRIEDGYLVSANADSARAEEKGLKGWLRTRSHLYLFLRSLVKQPGVGRAERVRAEIEAFNALADRGADATGAALEGLAADARGHGVPLVVAVVPMRHQIVEARDLDPRLVEHPNRLVSELASKAGLPVIDLLPAFRESALAGGPALYFRSDPHWTAEGHRLAGDALFDSLLAHGWIARDARPDEVSRREGE